MGEPAHAAATASCISQPCVPKTRTTLAPLTPPRSACCRAVCRLLLPHRLRRRSAAVAAAMQGNCKYYYYEHAGAARTVVLLAQADHEAADSGIQPAHDGKGLGGGTSGVRGRVDQVQGWHASEGRARGGKGNAGEGMATVSRGRVTEGRTDQAQRWQRLKVRKEREEGKPGQLADQARRVGRHPGGVAGSSGAQRTLPSPAQHPPTLAEPQPSASDALNWPFRMFFNQYPPDQD